MEAGFNASYIHACRHLEGHSSVGWMTTSFGWVSSEQRAVSSKPVSCGLMGPDSPRAWKIFLLHDSIIHHAGRLLAWDHPSRRCCPGPRRHQAWAWACACHLRSKHAPRSQSYHLHHPWLPCMAEALWLLRTMPSPCTRSVQLIRCCHGSNLLFRNAEVFCFFSGVRRRSAGLVVTLRACAVWGLYRCTVLYSAAPAGYQGLP